MLKHSKTTPLNNKDSLDNSGEDPHHHKTAYERLEISNNQMENIDFYDSLYKEKDLVEKGKLAFMATLKSSFPFTLHDFTLSFLEDFKDKKFTDSNFPPEISSLLDYYEEKNSWKHLIWLRPEYLVSASTQIFRRKPKANEIKVGIMKNSHFISAVGCLLETSNFIEQIFFENGNPNFESVSSKEKLCSNFCCYSLYLFDQGKRKEIVLDNYFPALEKFKPAFSFCLNYDLWMLLLEKAWAKIHNCYSNIEFGHFDEVLEGFTGFPVLNLWSKDENIISIIENSLKSKKLVFASVNNSNEEISDFAKGFSYPIASVTDGNICVLDIWNHMSKLNFNVFKPEIEKRELSLPEFTRKFEIVHILALNKDHSELKTLRTSIRKEEEIYLTVDCEGEAFETFLIGIHQESKRKYNRQIQNSWKYSMFRVILVRVEGKELQLVEALKIKRASTWLGINKKLTPGHYILQIKGKRILEKSKSLVISTRSKNQCRIIEFPSVMFEEFLESVSLSIREFETRSFRVEGEEKGEIRFGNITGSLHFLVFISHGKNDIMVEGKVGRVKKELKILNSTFTKSFKAIASAKKKATVIFSSKEKYTIENLPIMLKFSYQ